MALVQLNQSDLKRNLTTNTIQLNHNVANKMMKIAETEQLNYATSHNLGCPQIWTTVIVILRTVNNIMWVVIG